MPFSLTTRTSLRKPAASDLVDNDGILDYNWQRIEDNLIASNNVFQGIAQPGLYVGHVIYDDIYNGYFWWDGTKWNTIGLARSYLQGDPPGGNLSYTFNIPINTVTYLPVSINGYTGTGVIERVAGSMYYRMERVGTYYIQTNLRFQSVAALGSITVGIEIWDSTNTTKLNEYRETVTRNNNNNVLCLFASFMHRSVGVNHLIRFSVLQSVANPLVLVNTSDSFTTDVAFIHPKLGVNF